MPADLAKWIRTPRERGGRKKKWSVPYNNNGTTGRRCYNRYKLFFFLRSIYYIVITIRLPRTMHAEGSVLNRRDLANKTQSFVRKYTHTVIYIYCTSTFLLQIIIIYPSTYFTSSKFPSLTWRHGTYIILLYSIAGKCRGNLISRRGVMERAANRSWLYPYNIILYTPQS